jgi:hypothetical protein
VLEAGRSVRRKTPVTLERRITLRMVNSYDGDTDWISVLLKLLHLTSEVTIDTIDLFDHGFGKDFCLCADLNRAQWSRGHEESCFADCECNRNKFAEGPVSTPTLDSYRFVCCADYASLIVDSLAEYCGPIQLP